MTTIHNNSPLTVAWKTTAEAFYVNRAKHLMSMSKFRQNLSTPLQRNPGITQLSTPNTSQRSLPYKNIPIVLFKTT